MLTTNQIRKVGASLPKEGNRNVPALPSSGQSCQAERHGENKFCSRTRPHEACRSPPSPLVLVLLNTKGGIGLFPLNSSLFGFQGFAFYVFTMAVNVALDFF